MNKTAPTLNSRHYLLRAAYLLLAIITIVIGLATRKAAQLFHPFIAEYGGDTLWALLIFILLRLIMLRGPIWITALITYCFAIFIECSQLYQADWINRWRQTFPGQMILGQGFLWSDFLCYAGGVLLGCAIAFLLEKNSPQKSI